MKKFFALLMAVVMVLALSVPAFAEDTTYTLSAPTAGDDHIYAVYQIFTGDLSKNESGNKVLSNIKWGKNGTGEQGESVDGKVLEALEEVADGTNQNKLEVILKYADLTTALTTGKLPISELPAGYYLIKDSAAIIGDDAATTFIVQVVENVTITRKAAKPSVDKQVKDEADDAEVGNTEGWGETADHELNETFQFKLTATLPNDPIMSDYESYKLVFHDTLSMGITFENIDSVTVGSSLIDAEDYVATTPGNDGKWTLTIEDLTDFTDALPGTVVTVIYNAHLNENAVIANATTITGSSADDNQNKVSLEYSNNPNWDGKGNPPTGTTPPDIVFVFTYENVNTKFDGEPNEKRTNTLQGAGFKLYKTVENTTLWAVLDTNNKLTSWTEYETLPEESPTGAVAATEVLSGTDGKFAFRGLDAGTYYLKESTTPAGFNTVEDIEVVVSAIHNEDEESGKVTVEKNDDVSDPTVYKDVVNNRGSVLPQTGGIGTTIFYVVGAALAAGAAIILFAKKKVEE